MWYHPLFHLTEHDLGRYGKQGYEDAARQDPYVVLHGKSIDDVPSQAAPRHQCGERCRCHHLYSRDPQRSKDHW